MNNTTHNINTLIRWSTLTVTLSISGTLLAAPPGQDIQTSLDDRLEEVATINPAFGGLFYDENGDLNVYLTNPKAKAAVTQALQKVFGRELEDNNPGKSQRFKGKPTLGAGDFIIREAKFNMKQLGKWKKNAANVFSIDAVSFVDLDEAKNKITIGITDKAMQAAVESLLATHGVPLEAVNIEITEGVQALTHSVQSTHRPTKGGIQILFTNGTGLSSCTLGFNAYRYGVRGFVTNSHCTQIRGGTEGTIYYQASTEYVGYEYADPAYFTSFWPWECPWFKRCRYSDAAFVRYDSSVTANYGRIARTTSYNGSLLIDASRPEFRIVAKRASNIVGSYLDKVGRTTGWTYGAVTSTCVDTNVSDSDVHMKCQDVVSRGGATLVAPGDSGSPMFVWGFGDTVTLAGILWGGGGDTIYLSPMRYIDSELGGLSTF